MAKQAKTGMMSLTVQKSNGTTNWFPKKLNSNFEMLRIKADISGTKVRFWKFILIIVERHFDELADLERQFTVDKDKKFLQDLSDTAQHKSKKENIKKNISEENKEGD